MSPEVSYAVERLTDLADRLRERGWEVRMVVEPGRWPGVRVVNPRLRALNEWVVVAPAGDRWSYWYSWREPISPAEDPGAAAARIEGILRHG